MRKRKTNKRELLWDVFTIVGILVYTFGIIFVADKLSSKTKDMSNDIGISLQDIVKKEVNNITIPNGDCSNYSKYFYGVFKNYSALDVEPDWWICLEKNSTDCVVAHSYVVVGGYGSMCLLNSKDYHCYDFKESGK
jgi:hypothetical protein